MTMKLRYKTEAVFRNSQVVTDKYLTYRGEKIGQIKDVEPKNPDEVILVLQTRNKKDFFKQMEEELGKKMIYNPITLKKGLEDEKTELQPQ